MVLIVINWQYHYKITKSGTKTQELWDLLLKIESIFLTVLEQVFFPKNNKNKQ